MWGTWQKNMCPVWGTWQKKCAQCGVLGGGCPSVGYLGGVVPSVGLTPLENFLTEILKLSKNNTIFFFNFPQIYKKNLDIQKFYKKFPKIFGYPIFFGNF